jgi:hypothetical protein
VARLARTGRASEAPAARVGERWRVDAGAADIATLSIPPSAQRQRVFEIDLRFVVRAPEPLAGAWHEMTVELDGVRQWSRRIDTHNPGQTDSLDYHCRVSVALGRSLRVRAITQVGRAVRQQLLIEAEEATGA